MQRTRVVALADVGGLIPNAAVVSVSSSSGLGCPDAVLEAIGQHFVTTGQPRDLTTLHPIAAGDMYGIAGVDHLARRGLLRRIIAGSYPSGPSSLPPPRIWQLIDADVVVVPDQMQTTQTLYDPAISGELRHPQSAFEPVDWGVEKIIARRAALELHQDDAVNLGFGISALVPRILLEEGLDGAVTWVIEQGAVGGVPLLGFQFGCAANAQAIVPSPDQFTYFQGAGFDRSLLSFLQVDRFGNVNVSRLAARPHVTAGVGGFVDITANARHLVFSGTFTTGGLELAIEDGQLRILKEGRARKFVTDVEHVTFSGRRARDLRQAVVYVTERCVLRLEPEGLTVVEVAPGVDLERDVLGQAEVTLRVSPELRSMDPRLFRPARLGLHLDAASATPSAQRSNGKVAAA